MPLAEVLKLPFLELASSGLFAGSSCAKHEAGPSQGSVVGPGSFNIFIGDLEKEAEARLSNLWTPSWRCSWPARGPLDLALVCVWNSAQLVLAFIFHIKLIYPFPKFATHFVFKFLFLCSVPCLGNYLARSQWRSFLLLLLRGEPNYPVWLQWGAFFSSVGWPAQRAGKARCLINLPNSEAEGLLCCWEATLK